MNTYKIIDKELDEKVEIELTGEIGDVAVIEEKLKELGFERNENECLDSSENG